MKRFLIVAAVLGFVMGLGSGSASAAGNSLKAGMFGFGVGVGNSVFGNTGGTSGTAAGVITISGKYFVANDLAVTAGLGIQGSTGDVDANFFSIAGGLRKYLKVDDFAPFLEGRVTYVTEKFTGGAGGVHQDVLDLSGIFGAEYFLTKQFSFEGSIGFGIGHVENDTTNQDYTYFGTRTVGVSANFYF
ncbi:MAG TPA: hypothetical protein VEM40_14645 [Nitrospirota bacterium]|nr:hypothetical protein [Nitrospirota bacterium]